MGSSVINQYGQPIVSAHSSVIASRFRELFSHMPTACFTFDSMGIIQEWNGSAESLLGLSANSGPLTPIWKRLGASRKGLWSQSFVNDVFNGVPIAGLEWVRKTSDWEKYLICDIFPVRSQSGKIIGAISSNLDITERKKAENLAKTQLREFSQMADNLEIRRVVLEEANVKLEKLAVTDGLTGLRNHKCFHADLKSAYAEHKRLKLPISLVLIDLDNFKEINDTYGHPEGDLVLRAIAKLLQRAFRRQDCVARYGGDEFAVIMPGTGADAASIAADRFRSTIENAGPALRGCTVSVGVATNPRSDADSKALIARADMALYASKQSGRNRITRADSMTNSPVSPFAEAQMA